MLGMNRLLLNMSGRNYSFFQLLCPYTGKSKMALANQSRTQIVNRNGIFSQMATFHDVILQLGTSNGAITNFRARHRSLFNFGGVHRSICQMNGFYGSAVNFIRGDGLILN
ncbi:hypothetical protein D3C78_1177270 [compost metagenome]